MSTTSSSPQQRRQPLPTSGWPPERYIEVQLNKTRRDVKLVDLSSALMVLAGGVVGFLLVFAIVDHWMLPLAGWARWLLLAVLVVGSAGYFVAAILPLLVGRVNPVYAARAIEQSEPSLKNSVINFLLFRQDRAGLRAGVYEALKQQAARDLSHVHVESAVDRSRLIHIGYALIAVLVAFAAYTIASPKDSLQTVRRIAAPWADIARPSRVQIEDVEPGSREVIHGQSVTVSAACYNLYQDEPVTLVYSSLDGRISQQRLQMEPDSAGLHFRAELLPRSQGIQEDLIYRIEAGDAVTETYRLSVLPAPTLLVQQVEYEYPAYTRQPKRVIQRQGDVKGVEGTRVTVRALANQPIRWATLIFDPAVRADYAEGPADASAAPPETVTMSFDEQQAWASFVLQLDPASRRPLHAGYRLRFETQDGHRNPRAPLHRIEVTRDLSPEVEILTPQQERIELPVDRQQRIEVRAIDPDYGLRTVVLRAVAGGTDLLSANLLEDSAGRTGQVVRHYDFRPWEHAMNPGDTFVFWALATDNREAPQTGQHEPNVARTRTYHVTILPPENPVADEMPIDEAGVDEADVPPKLADQDQPAADAESAPSGTDTPEAAAEDEPGTQPDPQSADGSNGAASDGVGGSDDGSAEESSQAAGQDGAGQSGASESPPQGDGPPGEGSSASPDGDGSAGENGAPGGPSDGGAQPGPAGTGPSRPDGTSHSDATDGPGEPLHDGEVFERALEYMRSQQQTEGGHTRAEQDDTAATGDAGDGMDVPAEDSRDAADSEPDQQQTGDPTGAGQQREDRDQGEGSREDATGGEGGQPRGPAPTQPESPDESADNDGLADQPRPGGLGDTGDSGAGQASDDPRGSAEAEQENRDRPKESEGHDGPPRSAEEAQAPSQSAHQSDSESDSEGDRSGGGGEGPGQGADQPGSDSPGSQSPADDGMGASQESGAGDTAPRPGDGQVGEDAGGEPGTESGSGTTARPTPGAAGEGARAEDSGAAEADPVADGQPAAGDADAQQGGQQVGGGRPGPAEPGGFDEIGEVPPGDEPNLDYTRRATDLVLEYLKDQQQKPDPDLLDELGWTPRDLEAFLERWDSLRRQAIASEQERRTMDETLRSLGLRPEQGAARRTTSRDDAVRGLQESGAHGSPPPRYLEQFNAYKKGTARVDE